MRNLTQTLGALSVMLLLLGGGCTPPEEKYQTRHTQQAPVLDGVKEAVWQKAERKPVAKIAFGEFYWKDSLDLAAWYSSVWNKDGIYFFVEVQDDIVFTSAEMPPYDCDAVEIFLDLHNEKENAFKVGDDFQYTFRYDYESIYCNCLGTENVKTVFTKTGRGYNAEIFIPWKTLRTDPDPLHLVGFNVNVYDNDSRQTDEILKARETALSLSEEGESSWESTSSYGTMQMEK